MALGGVISNPYFREAVEANQLIWVWHEVLKYQTLSATADFFVQ
jgi:hypothetical protein